MKKWLVTIFAIHSIGSYAYETDKVAHFSVSYGLSFTGGMLCKKIFRSMSDNSSPEIRWFCPIASGLIALVPGLVKEMNDDYFDWRDMRANIYGSGSAALINLTFDF